MLQHEYVLANIDFDTAEKEPSKNWQRTATRYNVCYVAIGGAAGEISQQGLDIRHAADRAPHTPLRNRNKSVGFWRIHFDG